jgi:hypothetical protein
MNYEVKYQNSAGRLLALLKQLKPNQPFVNQLAPLLLNKDVANDHKSKSSLGLQCIFSLHQMYAQFIEDIENSEMSEEEKAVYMKGLNSLATIVFPTNFDKGVRQISEAETALLEVCATRIKKEAVLDKNDIEIIRSLISELKGEIESLPKKDPLKIILNELIRLCEDAINRFHIHGADGLKKAFKGMLAEVAEIEFHSDIDTKEVKKSEKWTKTVNLIKKVDEVAAKTLKYKPLLESGSKLFLGDGGA